MHCVLETHAFQKGCKEIGVTEEDVYNMTIFIAQNPDAGDLIKGTGGARKIRFPLGSKGKSGGCRVITYYVAEDIPVFLLDIFSKSEKINLSKKERNELKEILDGLAEDYRESVKRKTKRIGKVS